MAENNIKFIIRALRHRNYRLFFGGQGISLVGTWMQYIAVSWLVYSITKSAFILGVVGFASQIPAFIFMPFAGVLVDRWNQHKIVITTQILAMIQSLLLTALVITGHVTVKWLIGLSVLLGIINAFDVPARHALVFELVEDKDDLGNAIALNSSIFNMARLIGPLVAGIIIATKGEGACFLLNCVSYLPAIWALLAMRLNINKKKITHPHVLKGLKDGLNYAFAIIPIRYILLLVASVSLVGMPYAVLMPAYSTEVLHQGPQGFGFLMASAGCGAFIAAVYLAFRKNVLGLGKIIAISCAIFGSSLFLFSLSNRYIFSVLLMVFIGFGMMTQSAGCNTILQTIVEHDKRGRVMSLYAMAFIGMGPFGSLLIGSLASAIGIKATLMLSGVTCVLAAAMFAKKLPAMRSVIRPIYKTKGIIDTYPADK